MNSRDTDEEECKIIPAVTKPYSQHHVKSQHRSSGTGGGHHKHRSSSTKSTSDVNDPTRVQPSAPSRLIPSDSVTLKPTPIQQLRKYSVVDPEMCSLNREITDPSEMESQTSNLCRQLLIFLSYIVVFLTLPISLVFCIKVVAEYERAVIFRLGRIIFGGEKGPGLFFILPCIDLIRKVDLRTVTFDVPPQEVLTKDSVTVAVDAVVYYRIQNPIASVINVEDCDRSTRLLAATTLRNVLGTKDLAEILSERESISAMMQTMLDDATDPWGVKVERVEVKDVRLPIQLQRAMAAEAEATREARAKVIAAEGEQKSSKALKEAADTINCSPIALQLRYLQTLGTISAEHNSTIIFPFPIDFISTFCPQRRPIQQSPQLPSTSETYSSKKTGNSTQHQLIDYSDSNSKSKMPPQPPTDLI